MHRRDFSRRFVRTGLGLGLGAALAPVAHAQQGAPVEGRHYVRLSTPAPLALPGPDKKVEVVEFFWYGCPHCHAFEPIVHAWAKRLPADVAFRQVPVALSAPGQLHQRMYYALEESGQLDALHRKVFAAYHQQNKRFTSEAEAIEFVGANGGDGARFGAALKSFGTATKVSRARQLVEAYKIDGVPAVGVQGRWYTSASLAGSHERTVAVAEHLIQLARQGKV